MADLIPFRPTEELNIPNALMAHQQMLQAQRQDDAQNALAEAVPLLQTDPQNAFATAARKSPQAALQLLPVIKQMDDRKRAEAAERADAFAKAAMTLKGQKEPIIRKALLQSMAPELKSHGIRDEQIANFDPSDANLQTIINQAQDVKGLIAQANADRTYAAGRQDHADLLDKQDRDYNLSVAKFKEDKRHHGALEAEATGQAGGGLSDAAKVNAAVKYNLTGALPNFGMGKAARQDRLEVMNYAAELAKGVKPEQLVANVANFKALSGSLNTQTKQFNAIETAANAAKNSANLALQAAEKGGAGPTSVPIFNKWVQAGRKATGDLNVKNLANHLDTFSEEYAKVMTGATGASPATDSARQAAKERINAAYDLKGLKSILAEMGREMGGRHFAARAQIEGIQKQLAGNNYSEPQGVETAATETAAVPPPPPGFVVQK